MDSTPYHISTVIHLNQNDVALTTPYYISNVIHLNQNDVAINQKLKQQQQQQATNLISC